MNWITGCSKKTCCTQPNYLQQIYSLLCTFFTSLRKRFIDAPVQWSNYVDIVQTGVVVSAVAVKVESWQIFNSHTAPQWVRLYNLGNRLPTAADDADPAILKKRLLVPAYSGENLAGMSLLFPDGLAIRGTLSGPDGSNDAPVTPITVNLDYKIA